MRMIHGWASHLILACLVDTVPACVSHQPSRRPECVVAAIIEADNARNLQAAVDCYSDDVVWMSPDGRLVAGKQAISDRYRRMYAEYNVRLSANIEDVEAADTLAFVRGVTVGELSPRAGGDSVQIHDRFVAILRREDAGWKVARLMWATATPTSDK